MSDTRHDATSSTQQPIDAPAGTMAAPTRSGTKPRLHVTKNVSSESLIVSRRVKVGWRSKRATRPTSAVIRLLKVTSAMETANPKPCSALTYCASCRVCSSVRLCTPSRPVVRLRPSSAAAVSVTSVLSEWIIITALTVATVMARSSARATTRRSSVPHAAVRGKLVRSDGRFSKVASCGCGAGNARSRRLSRASSRAALAATALARKAASLVSVDSPSGASFASGKRRRPSGLD
eukprot:scaffold95215_cov26-Tisochrysis_lutea.AAC.3